jgi:hypothetical protein
MTAVLRASTGDRDGAPERGGSCERVSTVRSWRKSAASDLPLLAAGIVATPPRGHQRGMLPNPLGDIGLRCHHALLGRTVPGELNIFILAIVRMRDGADRQYDFNQWSLLVRDGSALVRPTGPQVSLIEAGEEVAIAACGCALRQRIEPHRRTSSKQPGIQ